jgi:hypothetical protein
MRLIMADWCPSMPVMISRDSARGARRSALGEFQLSENRRRGGAHLA